MPHKASIRLATVEDAAELARLLSPLGYPITADDVAAVWEAWAAEGNFALVVQGDHSLLGAITLHRMVVADLIHDECLTCCFRGTRKQCGVTPTSRGHGG